MITFHRNIRNLGIDSAYYRAFEWAPVADFQRLANCIQRFVWSPCRWTNGRRRGENFLEASLIGLDFDNGTMTLDQALNVFCDSAHIIGTTKSHQKDKSGILCDRFRVVLRLERPITDVETYRSTVAHYINKYDCDSACKDGARFFWPCREIVSILQDGYDQEIVTPAPKPPPVDYSAYREAKFIPRWVEQMLKFGVPDHTRNASCFKLGIYLTKCGYPEEEIVDLIMRSPIPISADVRPEVETAVRNGAVRGRLEIANEAKEVEAQTSAGGGEPMRSA